jgi:hypothetical protein
VYGFTSWRFAVWKKCISRKPTDDAHSIGERKRLLWQRKKKEKDLDNFKKGVKRDENVRFSGKTSTYPHSPQKLASHKVAEPNRTRVSVLDFDPTPLDDQTENCMTNSWSLHVLNENSTDVTRKDYRAQATLNGNATAVLREIVTFLHRTRVAEKASSDLLIKIQVLRSWPYLE